MSSEHPLEHVDLMPIIMPLGGYGTRAHPVTGDLIPKHLIKLDNGKTVLDTILHGLQTTGFTRFVFCLAHLKNQHNEHIEQGGWITAENVSYQFSEEDEPSGVDGAVLQAIGSLGLKGNGMILPGDLLLPWRNVAYMARQHLDTKAAITVGLTSRVTPRTTDVGKMIVDKASGYLVHCLARDEPVPEIPDYQLSLTSAAATAINIDSYVGICEDYRQAHPSYSGKPLSVRDQVMPWALSRGSFVFHTYDLQGEALDLGTPDAISYGQQNWNDYV